MKAQHPSNLDLSEAIIGIGRAIDTMEHEFLHVPGKIWEKELKMLKLKYNKLCAEHNRREDLM